jgi:hypothetical protein
MEVKRAEKGRAASAFSFPDLEWYSPQGALPADCGDTSVYLQNTYAEASVKAKLTVTIDETLLPRAKKYAHSRRLSLLQLIEDMRRDMSSRKGSFLSQRWRGKFQATERDDERYKSLARKYL